MAQKTTSLIHKKFSKVLIANRGEIACRLIMAFRSLGMKTVAVYSDADRGARHVGLADESFELGAGPSAESYLNIPRLLEAAAHTKAEAVHPGYGFLSERSIFAEAVIKAGLVWIGPSPEVIELMGNKIAAKKCAEKASVPTLPWALLTDGWKLADLKSSAKKVGYPLLLKAAAGGGGRGMRLVDKEEELEEKATAAAREALGAFGSGELFLESYCPVARHIEVQILGDSHGNIKALGERDCSAQRRHQKVIEESPAPRLSDKTRALLAKSATSLGKAVGYVNAGTCEFLVDEKENIYFLEMNTRLQVEHPVTEWTWGVDLPSLQVHVAQGLELPKEVLEKEKPQGHAIEVRLYAEDPSKNFMPSPGKIEKITTPNYPNLRFDCGYENNSEVPIFYDAMLAKLIAWGQTREQARLLLIEALKKTRIEGVAFNGFYLIDILEHRAFIESKIDTGFLGKEFKSWKGIVRLEEEAVTATASPVNTYPNPWMFYGSGDAKLAVQKRNQARRDHADHEQTRECGTECVAENPGKVLKVLVKPGQKISKDQNVVVCESMKMEFSYTAPANVLIEEVCVKEGDLVQSGTVLLKWKETTP